MLTNTGDFDMLYKQNQKPYKSYSKEAQLQTQSIMRSISRLFSVVGSPTLTPTRTTERSGSCAVERGYHPDGFKRQVAAIVATGDRERYSAITQPPPLFKANQTH